MILTCHVMGALGLAFAHTTLIRAYSITDTFIGHNFFDNWTWETFDDPTHGRVNYVDKWSAMSSGLSYASGNTFVMRVDADRNVPPAARGRDSVRIISNRAYGDSVVVLDLKHMPTGCGTWPAFWSLSGAGPWPEGGEIDIIEGVHMNTQNLASLHTTPGCTMSEPRGQNGQTVSANCDTSVNYNQGCGTSFTKPNSYGAPFNSAGGGWYVLERSKTRGINIWFWSRYDGSVPQSVSQGWGVIHPDDSWGLPEARFPVTSCDHAEFFDDHRFIFDTTFCGDWAGSVFSSSGCGSNCNDYVNNNPSKFKEAYWEINGMRVYT